MAATDVRMQSRLNIPEIYACYLGRTAHGDSPDLDRSSLHRLSLGHA
ncbi:hypothetical protein [Phormidium tenue]|nr:hypothetical protein [Phormidium tenue]MBD2234224.1 hypothetical protein [Phormidium tenue FACHB-1052]